MTRLILVLLFSLVSIIVYGQELSDRAQISIITGDPGPELYSLFGHSAIRVFDPATGRTEFYNYGTFDVEAPGFMFKFLRGKLLYFVSEGSYKRFLALYNYEKRSVREQVLDISPMEVKSIYSQLVRDTTGQNKYYYYDFFYDNCTTRLRDLLANNIDGLQYPTQPAGDYTMRDLLHLNLTEYPWTEFGMDLVLGATTDKKSNVTDQMFLPAFYHDYLNQSTANGEPLIRSDQKVQFAAEREDKQLWISPKALFIGLLVLELILFFLVYVSGDHWFAAWIDRIWFWLLFGCFLVFAFMWLATDHEVCRYNWNILWTVPWMPFLLSSDPYKTQRQKIMILITIILQVILLLGWSTWPQAMPRPAMFIALISIVKMIRQGGFYRILDRLLTYREAPLTAVFLLFLMTNVTAQEKITGISLVAPPQAYETDPFPAIQEEVSAGWIAIIPFGFSRKGQPKVHYNSDRQWWGERPDGIKHTIELAHANDVKVMLKPQVWIHDHWVGSVDHDRENDWQLWEETYREYMMTFVKIGVSMDVDMICIGTEYEIAAVKREKFWRQLIKDVREIYDGPITYSANWDSYEKIPFWDELDYVGISAYFPLDDSPTPSPLMLYTKWKPIVKELKKFSKKVDRPILFTEYGYLSVDGAAGKTWELEKEMRELPINEEAQSIALDALYRSFWNEDFWHGGFLWKWFPESMHDDQYMKYEYTPKGKKAAETISYWYSKSEAN